MHKLSNKTLLNHVIDTSLELNPEKIIVIVGHEAQMVKDSVEANNILFSLQAEQKGTGHAIMQTSEHLENFNGNTLILSGDVPLITYKTLLDFYNFHLTNNSMASLISSLFKCFRILSKPFSKDSSLTFLPLKATRLLD